jgi:hypothetical protein
MIGCFLFSFPCFLFLLRVVLLEFSLTVGILLGSAAELVTLLIFFRLTPVRPLVAPPILPSSSSFSWRLLPSSSLSTSLPYGSVRGRGDATIPPPNEASIVGDVVRTSHRCCPKNPNFDTVPLPPPPEVSHCPQYTTARHPHRCLALPAPTPTPPLSLSPPLAPLPPPSNRTPQQGRGHTVVSPRDESRRRVSDFNCLYCLVLVLDKKYLAMILFHWDLVNLAINFKTKTS